MTFDLFNVVFLYFRVLFDHVWDVWYIPPTWHRRNCV